MDNVTKISERINKGFNEYEKDVISMTDEELWEHCFADNDIDVDDFCVKELKRRFLKQAGI